MLYISISIALLLLTLHLSSTIVLVYFVYKAYKEISNTNNSYQYPIISNDNSSQSNTENKDNNEADIMNIDIKKFFDEVN